MRSATWRGSRVSRLRATTLRASPLFGPTHQPAKRGLADFGAKQPALGADHGVANPGDGQDIANQLLTAFRHRQCAAPQAIDEIDLLNRVDAQSAGQPELVDAPA